MDVLNLRLCIDENENKKHAQEDDVMKRARHIQEHAKLGIDNSEARIERERENLYQTAA